MGIKANKHRGRNRYHGRGKKAGRGAGKRGGRGLAGINKHRVMTRIKYMPCLLYTSPSLRDRSLSRMPSSA